MSDIVDELRRIADIELTGYSEKMMRQAADEIERLRRERDHWRNLCHGAATDSLVSPAHHSTAENKG